MALAGTQVRPKDIMKVEVSGSTGKTGGGGGSAAQAGNRTRRGRLAKARDTGALARVRRFAPKERQ
jgi:hypothetical protein